MRESTPPPVQNVGRQDTGEEKGSSRLIRVTSGLPAHRAGSSQGPRARQTKLKPKAKPTAQAQPTDGASLQQATRDKAELRSRNMSSIPSTTPSQLVPPRVVETDVEEARILPIPFPKRAGAPFLPGCPALPPVLPPARAPCAAMPPRHLRAKPADREPLEDTATENKEKGKEARVENDSTLKPPQKPHLPLHIWHLDADYQLQL